MNKMTWPRQRWVVLVFLLCFIAVAVFIFRKNNDRPLQAVPSQSVVVVEFHGLAQAGSLVAKMPDAGWKAVLQNTLLQACWQDAAIAERLFHHDKSTYAAFAGNELAAALTLNEADSLHPLFSLDLGAEPDLEALLKTTEGTPKFFPSFFHGHTLYTVHFSKKDRLVLTRVNNLLLFSRFSYLVEDALTQLEQGDHWWADRSWRHQLDAGAPFKIYFRPLAAPLSPFLNDAWRFIPDMLSHNIAWLGFSWDGEHLRGAVKTDGFLEKMAQQNQAPHEGLFAVLPDNTAFLAAAGLARRDAFSDLFQGNNADFQKFILPWLGNEAAYAVTEPFSAELRDEQFILLSMRDSVVARQRLEAFGSQRGLLRQYDYQTFQVRQYLSAAPLKNLIREDSPAFRNPACAMVGNYVVFAGTTAALELLIDKYVVNETLLNTPDFLQQRQKIATQGSATFLLNTNYLQGLLKRMATPRALADHSEGVDIVAQTGFIGLELSTGRNTGWLDISAAAQNLSGGRKPGENGSSILWKTPLADAAATPPSVVMRAKEGDAEVFIQDKKNELYCLRASGAIAWRRQFDKPLLSAVQGIDFQNNGTTCFLFNTASHIWLIDEEGHDVEGFPLKLQSAATNGLSVVDFDDNRRYSLFVACANGNIYGYDQFGRPLPGWNPQGGVGNVGQPVLHFQRENKDYLVALSRTGRLSVFGRDGAARFSALQFEGKFNGPPQADALSRSPRIVCANTAGRVFVCTLDGGTFALSLTPRADASQRASFVFAPLDGDGRFDYAVLKGNSMNLAGYAGGAIQTIAKIQFSDAPDTLFSTDGGARLGALNRAKHQIFLLDNRGKTHPDFPLAGDTPFVLSELFAGRRERVLIVGNGANVYAYKIR